MYKIKLDLPGLPKGGEGSYVTIDGLGLLQNGKEYTVSPEEALAFRTHNARVDSVIGPNGETSYETKLGPTLLEAFKENEHITVEKTETDKEAKK